MSIYILSEKKFENAKNLPCIVINYFQKDVDLSKYEALIFTSKNSVEAIDRLDKSWREIPSFSIGSGTSLIIKNSGGKLVYEAKNSYGDEFAKEIKKRLEGKKVLFLRAKKVTSKLNQILLNSGVKLEEEIVYESVCNDCKNLQKPENGSCIVFSSPSTIECFFNCFSWDSSFKAVVIGKVTERFMPKDVPYTLSDEQNIPSCIIKCFD